MMEYTDSELLDWLQEQNDKATYTGKCVFRNSTTGRGWRLHETSAIWATKDVRYAIVQGIKDELRKDK